MVTKTSTDENGVCVLNGHVTVTNTIGVNGETTTNRYSLHRTGTHPVPEDLSPDEIDATLSAMNLENEDQIQMTLDLITNSSNYNGDKLRNSSGSSLESKASSDTEDNSESSMCCLVTNGSAENKGGATADQSESEKKDEDSVVDMNLLHDHVFTIKIVAPGVEPFDIQVSAIELVQEIHQVLMEREDTCHRTCFSLQLNGVTLDNYAELKTIEGLTEGATVKVVEEMYTVREARIHVRHVRDLLKCLDSIDAYNGVDGSSLSFLSTISQGDATHPHPVLEKKIKFESVDCTPPDYIMPNSKDRPLTALHPHNKEHKNVQCVKVLTMSGWNPPPGNRKMHGDLLYLSVITLEDTRFHITASTRGFFVNQTTDSEFNPAPSDGFYLCHSLLELMSSISVGFKRNLALLQKKRSQRHPLERVPTSFQVFQWVSPQSQHTIDYIRAEDAFSSKLGYEELIPGQSRDWNEELQTTRELPRKTLPERLLRERAVFKVYSDFVAASVRGAVSVVDGNVMAINPGEEAKMQMFIWNNIFFSLGFDVKDHYKDLGRDAAAYVAPKNDLQGVKVFSAIDQEGLYTLGTVVVDYRGFRVTAQSIIPGILEREQEQSVVYGSIDFGKSIATHDKYLDLLGKASQQLKMLRHKVCDEKGEEFELCSSVECKGIIGNDGRHYILDLLRTFPPDVNFLRLDEVDVSRELKAMGFPIEHKQKLACLRQELIEAFVDARYVMFVKCAAYHLQQLGLRKQKERQEMRASAERELSAKKDGAIENGHLNGDSAPSDIEADEAKKLVESFTEEGEARQMEETTKEIVRKAALAVSSLKDNMFDIRFNPDVFSPGVHHPTSNEEQLNREKKLVKEAAEFLVTYQIPCFIREFLDHSSAPLDGVALSDAMHNKGINIRYLGKVADTVAKIPELEYIHRMTVQEVLIRSTKHVFTLFLQSTETMALSSAISHFLNCFLSSCHSPHAPVTAELLQSKQKKKNRRKNRLDSRLNNVDNEWCNLSPASLWQQITKEARSYYDFKLFDDGSNPSVDNVCERYGFEKVALLRYFCITCGVQILLRDYTFDSRSKQTFSADDIINVFPVANFVNQRATDASAFYTAGQSKIQQGYIKDGYEMISEALGLLNHVYGAVHPEIVQCLRTLARLNYVLSDYQEALSFQHKATMMSERVHGVDHASTIQEYIHLAFYSFANYQVSISLKLLYRARYLSLLVCGENHPQMAVLDSNIGLILHAVGEFDLSLRFLNNALKLSIKYYGAKNLKTAVGHHLVARAQSCMGDFRTALQHEKETYAIYKLILGEEHDKTKESYECLKHLTQQAVVLQRKMHEMYASGKASLYTPPIQTHTPTMGTVLEMLNVINGILFVQITQQDIDNYKNECEKREREELGETRTITDGKEQDAMGSTTPEGSTLPAQTPS